MRSLSSSCSSIGSMNRAEAESNKTKERLLSYVQLASCLCESIIVFDRQKCTKLYGKIVPWTCGPLIFKKQKKK